MLQGLSIREALMGLFCFALVFLYIKKGAPTCPVQKTVTVTQEDKKEQTHEQTQKETVTTTKTVTKGGDTITQTIVEHDLSKVFEKSDDVIKSKQVTTTSDPNKYSLGVSYLPAITRAPQVTDFELHGAMRLGDTNFWSTAGFDFKYKQATVGLEYQF